MEILFNELSLTGQFPDMDSFVNTGLLQFVGVLKEMQSFSTLLLKRSDAWSCYVTKSKTLHSLLIDASFRNFDEVRRLKTAIAELTMEPYWDNATRQVAGIAYLLNGVNISGSSPAEACERDRVIVSFVSSPASIDPLIINRDGKDVPLLNLLRSGILTEHLWANERISFESYVKARFSKGKLDFTKIDPKMGFSGIQPDEQSLFIDTFRKFEILTWDQILTDDGLKYSIYHRNISPRYRGTKTYKFRASQKIRCHGYREKDSFIVIGFEVDHKLSDEG